MQIFAIVAGRIPQKDEVVCFNTAGLFDHFVERIKHRPDISYTRISADDAAKLMIEGNGVGTGCYLASRLSDVQAIRETRARKNMVEFAMGLNIAVSLQTTRLQEPRVKLTIVA